MGGSRVLGCVTGRVAPHVTKRVLSLYPRAKQSTREQHNKRAQCKYNVTLRRVFATIVCSVTPRPLSTPGERPGTHCTGGWVGPRGRSGQVQKIPSPPGFDPRTVQPVASRYTDYATRPTDIEALLYNSCSGKAMSITYSVCVYSLG